MEERDTIQQRIIDTLNEHGPGDWRDIYGAPMRNRNSAAKPMPIALLAKLGPMVIDGSLYAIEGVFYTKDQKHEAFEHLNRITKERP